MSWGPSWDSVSGVPLGAVGSWKCSSNHAAPNTVMLATTVKAYLGAGGVGPKWLSCGLPPAPALSTGTHAPIKLSSSLGSPLQLFQSLAEDSGTRFPFLDMGMNSYPCPQRFKGEGQRCSQMQEEVPSSGQVHASAHPQALGKPSLRLCLLCQNGELDCGEGRLASEVGVRVTVKQILSPPALHPQFQSLLPEPHSS